MDNIKNINQARNKQKSQQTTISIDDTTVLQCSGEDCESQTFTPAVKIGLLSNIHPKNPTGKVQHIQFGTYICTECGEEMTVDQ